MKLPRLCRLLVLIISAITVCLNVNYFMVLYISEEEIPNNLKLTLDAEMNKSDSAILGQRQITKQQTSLFGYDYEMGGIKDTIPFRISHRNISNYTQIISTSREKQGFLTIGIPSIKRINGIKYLVQTINSIINRTSEEEKNSVIIVVFLCDPNTTHNDDVASKLASWYSNYVESGFIHILRVLPEFYPNLTGLKRNFGDKSVRVTWRSKQVLDYAFMFFYSQHLNQYYIQIEDDVICAKDFVASIRSFIYTQRKKTWSVLEFSELGFIGKLFKSSDLPKLVTFMVNFFDEQPVDWLITPFRIAMAQRNVIMRKPTLFQHMGLVSSFDITKENKLKDKYFQDDSTTPPRATKKPNHQSKPQPTNSQSKNNSTSPT